MYPCKCVSCEQHTVRTVILIQFDSLCLLIDMFSPFTFNAIMDKLGFKRLIIKVLSHDVLASAWALYCCRPESERPICGLPS